MSNRITSIKENLSDIKTKLKSSEENGELVKMNCMGEDFEVWKFKGSNQLAYHEMMEERLKATISENIKEADAMIELCNDCGWDKLEKDWQNLKTELEGMR